MSPGLLSLRPTALACGLALLVAGSARAVEVELGLLTFSARLVVAARF